jgi:hypothetical protein
VADRCTAHDRHVWPASRHPSDLLANQFPSQLDMPHKNGEPAIQSRDFSFSLKRAVIHALTLPFLLAPHC